MDISAIAILEAGIIALLLSIDSFTAGFAYGSNKIKIPFASVQVITFVSSTITGISFLVGNIVKDYIPSWIATAVCFTVLFTLGIIKLLDGITKSIIRKYNNLNKELKFSIFNFKVILNLYANPEKADFDSSKTISIGEATILAVSLSLDGLAVGFSSALTSINGLLVFMFSIIVNSFAIILGCSLGNKIAKSISLNLSWMSGIILMIIGLTKLF